MHFYLFDAFLADSHYKKELEAIENRILDLGIGGRSTCLSVLKSFEDSLENGLTKEITTCVLIGNDETLTKALGIVLEHNVTLGFIPVDKNSRLARYFGIPQSTHAVDLIASRLTETLDIGKINQQYFISSVSANSSDLTLKCDSSFELQFGRHLHLDICNLNSSPLGISNPQDGFLEVWLYSEKHRLFGKNQLIWNSRLYHNQIQITAPKETSLLIDGHKIIKTPADISVLPQRLKFIAGRDRIFRK